MNKALNTLVMCSTAALLVACGGGGTDEILGQVASAQGTRDVVVMSEAAAAAVPSPQRYSFTDLGTLVREDSYGNGVNNRGEVAGYAQSTGTAARAILWNGTTATDLGTFAADTVAFAINNHGQIAGHTYTASVAAHATLWNGTTPTDLGTLGGRNSYAHGINDSGQVAGYSNTADSAIHAAVWTGTGAIDLGTLGGTNSWALGINNSGQIVGRSEVTVGSNFPYHATFWNGTTAIDLGTLGGTFNSEANAINDRGQVVGCAATVTEARHAALWNGTTATDLGTLGGRNSCGSGINNSGLVVGQSDVADNAEEHATLWDGTSVIDLNSFLDASTVSAGWYLQRANGISDAGSITGIAFNSRTLQTHAFLLTPLTDKEQCKKGGWQSFGFPNQGPCIRFVNTGK